MSAKVAQCLPARDPSCACSCKAGFRNDLGISSPFPQNSAWKSNRQVLGYARKVLKQLNGRLLAGEDA